jgi:hypothetical protein
MKNRKFKDLSNNRVVEVTDQFEDIIILDNKNKIKVNQLLDKRLFEEYVDPTSFLRNDSLISTFAEQIKKIPLDDIRNRIPADDLGFGENDLKPTMEESAVLPYHPELEREELLKKAKSMYSSDNTNTLIQRQWDTMKNILSEDEDPQAELLPQQINESVQQSPNQIIQNQVKTPTKMDPILEMFKNVKRNTNFKIDFTVENKIPRVDFIEMMEDSYNTSIIDFLAQEFTDDIVRDPSIIKEKIKSKLMDLVYPEVEKVKKQND